MGSWKVFGVTSFGIGCARAAYPDVYTFVPHYVGWIKDIVERVSTSSIENPINHNDEFQIGKAKHGQLEECL